MILAGSRPSFHPKAPRAVSRIPLFPPIIALACALALCACSDPLTPVQPVWDVNVNVPLSAETYTLEDLLEDDGALKITHDAGNLLILRKTVPIRSIAIGDQITLGNTTYDAERRLGGLVFDIPTLCTKSFQLRDVFPTLHEGPLAVIPFTSTDGISIPLDNTRFFSSITYETGTVQFTIENTLPFAVTFPTPAELLDGTGKRIMEVPIDGRLEPFSRRTLPLLRVDGLTFSGAMSLKLHLATPGTGGLPVNLTGAMGINVTGSILETRVREATGYLPAQTITWNETLDVTHGSGFEVQEGRIRQGQLDLFLLSDLRIGTRVTIDVPGLTDNGTPVSRTIAIPAQGSMPVTMNLAGCTIHPRAGRFLDYTVTVVTDPAIDRMVMLAGTDRVSVHAHLHEMLMERMVGVIAPRDVVIDQVQDIDFEVTSKLRGDIEFTDARITVRLSNGTIFPVELQDGSLHGSNSRTGRSAGISVPRSMLGGNARTDITFDRAEVVAFLNTFSTDFPDRLGFSGRLVVNPDHVSGVITSSDSITAELDVEIPMHIRINAASVVDTTAFTLDETTRRRMNDMLGGSITFDLENHLPAGVVIEPVICDASHRTLVELTTRTGDAIDITAAGVDGNGNVSTPTRQRTEIELTQEDFRKLLDGRWLRLRVNLKTPSPGPVSFRSTDHVTVRAHATVKVQSTIVSH